MNGTDEKNIYDIVREYKEAKEAVRNAHWPRHKEQAELDKAEKVVRLKAEEMLGSPMYEALDEIIREDEYWINMG